MLLQSNSPTNQIVLKELEHSEIELWIKRDDQINPLVSGNKLFKLIRNIEEALDKGKETHSHVWWSLFESYCRHCAVL